MAGISKEERERRAAQRAAEAGVAQATPSVLDIRSVRTLRDVARELYRAEHGPDADLDALPIAEIESWEARARS